MRKCRLLCVGSTRQNNIGIRRFFSNSHAVDESRLPQFQGGLKHLRRPIPIHQHFSYILLLQRRHTLHLPLLLHKCGDIAQWRRSIHKLFLNFFDSKRRTIRSPAFEIRVHLLLFMKLQLVDCLLEGEVPLYELVLQLPQRFLRYLHTRNGLVNHTKRLFIEEVLQIIPRKTLGQQRVYVSHRHRRHAGRRPRACVTKEPQRFVRRGSRGLRLITV